MVLKKACEDEGALLISAHLTLETCLEAQWVSCWTHVRMVMGLDPVGAFLFCFNRIDTKSCSFCDFVMEVEENQVWSRTKVVDAEEFPTARV
ncbi:unnamed protein product [Nippostrongylus brasiliensis]|uniref:Ovule protein n=1 Tax=Nippostrongylus brasiliensis TaxID=27835 RepID=A0A0N4Y1Q5_NIPBR|nr:unnamed protein product [Nippostrongylus brasiliensis]